MGRRTARLAAATLVLGVLAAGCTDEQRKQLSPTCAIAQTAVDDAQRQAENAIATISEDPATARRTLTAVKTALSAAKATVSGDERAQLENAEQAVADLLAQARRSAKGRSVDGAVVTEAREGLLAAVKGVRADC